jgi:Methyltransferase domain
MGALRLRLARLRTRAAEARRLPAGIRLVYLADPLFRRMPTPFAALLARQLRLPVRTVVRHVRAARSGPLNAHLDRERVELTASGQFGQAPGAVLYGLVRTLRPELVVETGVANGVSSAFILAALRANGTGRLVSIDLPFTVDEGAPSALIAGSTITTDQWSPIPPGRSPGWLVPEELRDRWDLRLGDSRVLLPHVLAESGEIGVFLHDSLHTVEHMLFEFDAAWPRITGGGLLVVDDAGADGGRALHVFSRSVGLPVYGVGGVAFIRKP